MEVWEPIANQCSEKSKGKWAKKNKTSKKKHNKIIGIARKGELKKNDWSDYNSTQTSQRETIGTTQAVSRATA